MSTALLADTSVLKPLNPRQQRFVDEYLHDLNGTKAAIRAGYSPDTANEQASRLLADVNVGHKVQQAKEVRAARMGVTAESIINELLILANARINHYEMDANGNLVPTPEAPEGAMAAVKSLKKKTRVAPDGTVTYEVEFALWDKPGQLKLMGKHAGVAACSDRVEITGKDGGPIVTALADMDAETLATHLETLKAAVGGLKE